MIAKPTSAQSIATPSIPQFTLQYVVEPYNVAPITTINPYTGQNVTAQAGYTVENQSIYLKITNYQPFTSFSVNGSEVNQYYQVQFKGHYANASSWQFYSLPDSAGSCFNLETSNYPIILISSNYFNFPNAGQIDFRVRAPIGLLNLSRSIHWIP